MLLWLWPLGLLMPRGMCPWWRPGRLVWGRSSRSVLMGMMMLLSICGYVFRSGVGKRPGGRWGVGVWSGGVGLRGGLLCR